MFKRFFILTAISLVVLAAFFYASLNSPKVFSFLATIYINNNSKELKVDSLKIKSQKFFFPDCLVMEGVGLRLKSIEANHIVYLNKLTIKIFSLAKIKFKIENADYKMGQLKVNHLDSLINLDMAEKGPWVVEGNMDIGRILYEDYELTDIKAGIAGNDKNIRLNSIRADLYKGRLEGDILLEYKPALVYSIAMNFSGVDSRLLKKINPAVFSQLEGVLNGSINLKGNPEQISYLKGNLDVPAGGRLEASLLGFISQYIPSSKEKDRLDFLIKTNGMVDVELASVNLESLSQGELKGEVHLASRQLNLQINVPMDIKVDGELTSVLQNWEKILK